MERIYGSDPLSRKIKFGRTKDNPLGLKTAECLVLSNMPLLTDNLITGPLLEQQRIAVEPIINDRREMPLGGSITKTEASYDLAWELHTTLQMRGFLLAHLGEVRVSLSGGYIRMRVKSRFGCAVTVFPPSSFRATENFLMVVPSAEAGTILAEGVREPRIGDLAPCLMEMGLRIEVIVNDKPTIDDIDRQGTSDDSIAPNWVEPGSSVCTAVIGSRSISLPDA
jgi:UDP-N-acetylglucosamine 1-carboxyvinyltransferase